MLDTSAGIIASPGVWLRHFEPLAGRRNAERWYIRMLMTIVSGSALLCDLSAPFEDSMPCFVKMRHGSFSQFGDESLSVTHREALENSHAMLSSSGITRLKNLAWILQEVNTKGINGSFLEAGVWRGGSSIFSTAVMDLYQMERPIYLCDSFHGLPRPRAGSPRPDETQYQSMNRMGLAVGEKTVLRNFDVYSVPTRNVHTIPGYFVNSLPPLRDQLLQRGERLSVLRLDGDMYDSTMDSLYNLYDLVSVGGFIIIDDFIWSAGSSVQGTRLENRTMTTAFGGAAPRTRTPLDAGWNLEAWDLIHPRIPHPIILLPCSSCSGVHSFSAPMCVSFSQGCCHGLQVCARHRRRSSRDPRH